MTAPERPAGLPEAFEWDDASGEWHCVLREVVLISAYQSPDDEGDVWRSHVGLAWDDYEGIWESDHPSARRAIVALIDKSPRFVSTALRALLGEPEAESDVERLTRERDEAREEVEEQRADLRSVTVERDLALQSLAEARAEVERLTARAEKAEAERDALVAVLEPFAAMSEAWGFRERETLFRTRGVELLGHHFLAAAKAVRS